MSKTPWERCPYPGLKAFLDATNYNQTTLAAATGISASVISRYIKGDIEPTIQPFDFYGKDYPYSKKTCLWLKNVPNLEAVEPVKPVATWGPSGSYSHRHGEQHRGMFTTDRAKNRSKTFPGIARAMAEQWGGNIRED